MYTDNALELLASGTDCSGDLFTSTAIDLSAGIGIGGTITGPTGSPGIVSPDVGTGKQVVALINVEAYTVGTNAGVTIDVVTSASSTLSTPRVIGSTGLITTGQMEEIDDAGRLGYAPIVIRMNPDHFTDIDVAGTAERYLGLLFTHTTNGTDTLECQASLTDCFQSRPEAFHHTSGITIA